MISILVSIIMPVYNAMPFLKEAVFTVLNQDYKDIELICVDDGSTDDSYDYLCEYSKKDSRLIILQQPNLGAGAARNFGLSIAQGQYLLFLDADDVFYPSLISSAVAMAELKKAEVVVYRFESYNMKNGEKKACDYAFQKEHWNSDLINRFDNPSKILTSFNPCAWNKLFKKSFIVHNQLLFQGNMRTNDLYFVSCAMATANRIALLDKTLVSYRIGNENSSQSTNNVAELDFFKALLGVKSYLENNGLLETLKGSFMCLCENTIIHNLKKSRDNGKAIYYFLKQKGLKQLDVSVASLPRLQNFLSRYMILDYKKRIINSSTVKPNVLRKGKVCNNIKVSVIIPVYNVQDYLLDCLKSVSCQSLKEIEIIAVNDGSTDSSRDILLEYCNCEPRLTVLEQENAGLSMSRNNGQIYANGEYLYFLDSDDMLVSNALEELYRKANNENIDVLFFDAEAFFEDGMDNNHQGYATYYQRTHDYSSPRNGKQLLRDMQRNNEYRPSVPLQFIRKSFYRDNKLSFYPALLYEDNLFTFKELLFAKRCAHIRNKYYKRRLRCNSIVTSKQTFINAYCYYVCWRDISSLLKQDVEFAESTEVKDLTKRLYQAYERIYNNLSCDEKQNIIFTGINNTCNEHMVNCSRKQDINIAIKTYSYFLQYGLINTIKKVFTKICTKL